MTVCSLDSKILFVLKINFSLFSLFSSLSFASNLQKFSSIRYCLLSFYTFQFCLIIIAISNQNSLEFDGFGLFNIASKHECGLSVNPEEYKVLSATPSLEISN